jgi:hypothetical protein
LDRRREGRWSLRKGRGGQERRGWNFRKWGEKYRRREGRGGQQRRDWDFRRWGEKGEERGKMESQVGKRRRGWDFTQYILGEIQLAVACLQSIFSLLRLLSSHLPLGLNSWSLGQMGCSYAMVLWQGTALWNCSGKHTTQPPPRPSLSIPV